MSNIDKWTVSVYLVRDDLIYSLTRHNNLGSPWIPENSVWHTLREEVEQDEHR